MELRIIYNRKAEKTATLELLKSHPYPRYSGPFENSIFTGWAHKCLMERSSQPGDSFTIPFYADTLEEANIRLPNGHGLSATDNWIKHAGIPRSCKECQVDLLDHQIHHHVLHLQCKFCNHFTRLLNNNPLENIWKVHGIPFIDHSFKAPNMENYNYTIYRNDEITCKFCYKYFSSPATRKFHEKNGTYR